MEKQKLPTGQLLSIESWLFNMEFLSGLFVVTPT